MTLLIQRYFYSSPLSAIQLRHFWWAHKNPSNHSQKLRPLDGFSRGIITHNISPIEASLQWIPVHVHNTFFFILLTALKASLVLASKYISYHMLTWICSPRYLSLFKKLTRYSKGCRACARPSWSWPAWGDHYYEKSIIISSLLKNIFINLHLCDVVRWCLSQSITGYHLVLFSRLCFLWL